MAAGGAAAEQEAAARVIDKEGAAELMGLQLQLQRQWWGKRPGLHLLLLRVWRSMVGAPYREIRQANQRLVYGKTEIHIHGRVLCLLF